MRVLFVSRWLPYPTDNGSRLRIYNLLKGISSRHRVHLLAFSDLANVSEPVSVLSRICESIDVFKWREFQPSSPRALMGALSPAPRSVVDTYSPAMAAAVRHQIAQGMDAVVASEWPTMAYARIWKDVPAIMEDIELGSFDVQRRGGGLVGRLRKRLMQWKMNSLIARSTAYFRAYTVVSEPERCLLSSVIHNQQAIEVIPNGVDVSTYAGFVARRRSESIVFTGALTFEPNLDAILFFLDAIFPRVRKMVPGAQISITGRSACGSPLAALTNPGVVYLGHLPDIRPVVAGSEVAVVPVRHGGGTRLKILEAMALGTPVVSTSKGAEGLEVRDGEHLLIGDTSEQFAAQVVRLLYDADLRRVLAGNARRLVENTYDWKVIVPRFLDLLDRVELT